MVSLKQSSMCTKSLLLWHTIRKLPAKSGKSTTVHITNHSAIDGSPRSAKWQLWSSHLNIQGYLLVRDDLFSSPPQRPSPYNLPFGRFHRGTTVNLLLI
uniref:Sgo1 n=1 Tax=Arundo donax TaxID=35708 RepID=A0A0A9E4B4_ARUDO